MTGLNLLDKQLRIVICGDNLTGKRTLMRNLNKTEIVIQGRNYKPKFYSCSYNINDKNNHLFREADGFIILYSVDSVISHSMISYFVDEIYRFSINDTPVIVVANKIDLPKKDYVLGRDEGKEIEECFNIPFVEISAKNGINVEKPITYLISKKLGLHTDIRKRKKRCAIM